MTKKFDDAKWHYGGDFPADLPIEAGFTHIGMFVSWAISAGLVVGEEDLTNLDELRRCVLNKTVTPGELLNRTYDGKFLDDSLSEEGKKFATTYYENGNGYIADYDETLGQDVTSLYYVKDSWGNFEKLKPILDQRLDQWRRGELKLEQQS